MPELPEVEVCRRGLQPELTGERILGAIVRSPRLRLPLPATLGDTLAGQQVVAVRRRGKYLLLDCRGGVEDGCLIIHLGMSGNLRFVANDKTPGKHDHVDILFARQTLRLADPRRFGVVLWQAVGKAPHPLLAALGRRRAGPIKPVLMDSHLVVGIGNIYAAESLFRAGISPLGAANRISREPYGRLVAAIRQTLTEAIAAGGSSIRDYVHSDGGAGCFQVECAVYGRAGEPCRRCAGVIHQVRQGGRSTFYCPSCQY